MPWAEDWNVGLNLPVGPAAFPTTCFQFLLVLKTACLISDFRWANTELRYLSSGPERCVGGTGRPCPWALVEPIETLRFFRVSRLLLALTVCQCRWGTVGGGGKRRQLFKEYDLLILLVGQAFLLDPAENTLFAAAAHRSPYVQWYFSQVQVGLRRLRPLLDPRLNRQT